MKYLFILILIFSSFSIFSQESKIMKNIDWNGYTQLRASSNFNDNTSFMLRRLKFWIKSTPEFSEHWSYKLQTTVTSLQQEKFFLQDVKINYKTGLFSFDFGQFVPAYSLQRFQPDYKIPAIERAKTINCLIPNGTIGVRDIGVQANFTTKNKLLETHFGIFNGYGIKEYRFDNQGYMLSHKTTLNIPINKNRLQIGYSVQYRKAENLKIPKVLPDTVLFTGNDFRYNIFAMFKSNFWELQAEYLTANFDGQKADGYYILSAVNINKKNQIVAGYEDYNDLIGTTENSQFYRLGYNYYINNYKTKVSFDNYFQIVGNNINNYFASVQLQIFFK